MLILTRKSDESILIGDDVEVKILWVKGNKVRIGIDAPDDVDIFREEVYDKIQDEQKG